MVRGTLLYRPSRVPSLVRNTAQPGDQSRFFFEFEGEQAVRERLRVEAVMLYLVCFTD